MDIAAALPIATSTPVTDLRQCINSDLGYNDLKFSVFCTKIATVISLEVAITNVLSFHMLNFTFYNQKSFGNSDRAAYSDLNPRDGGQSLYPMSTVMYLNYNPLFFLGCRYVQLAHFRRASMGGDPPDRSDPRDPA